MTFSGLFFHRNFKGQKEKIGSPPDLAAVHFPLQSFEQAQIFFHAKSVLNGELKSYTGLPKVFLTASHLKRLSFQEIQSILLLDL